MRITDFDPALKKPLSWKDRAALYNSKFYDMAKNAPMVVTPRWIYGKWMMGNDYRKKTDYYGGYPSSYLDRVLSMFPDSKRILHIFSGMLDSSVPGDRLDINPDRNPDIVCDAHDMSTIMKDIYDLIIADPPYSEEDARHYGTSMIDRKKVVHECFKVLKPGGFMVWLDQVLPMYRKKELKLVGIITVIISTNHRVRCAFIWQKPTKRKGLDSYSG